jgi:hypothetical protein
MDLAEQSLRDFVHVIRRQERTKAKAHQFGPQDYCSEF